MYSCCSYISQSYPSGGTVGATGVVGVSGTNIISTTTYGVGTGSITVPAGAVTAWISMIGGGGGAATDDGVGGGGGGVFNYPVSVTVGGTITYTVGFGGLGSPFIGIDADDGMPTIVTIGSVTLTGNGGIGGGAGQGGNGGSVITPIATIPGGLGATAADGGNGVVGQYAFSGAGGGLASLIPTYQGGNVALFQGGRALASFSSGGGASGYANGGSGTAGQAQNGTLGSGAGTVTPGSAGTGGDGFLRVTFLR